MQAALSLILHQPESPCLNSEKVIGSAGIGQGSLKSGVNEPGTGTKSGQQASPPSAGEDLAQTTLEMAGNSLGFDTFGSEIEYLGAP